METKGQVTVKNEATKAVSALVGKRIWHVGAGGSAGSSFSIDLGRRVPRKSPLRNTDEDREFRENGGEVSLLVWCAWRLDSRTDSLASSDETPRVIAKKLRVLLGQRVRAAVATSNAGDLRIRTSDYVLYVFCEFVPGKPSFDGNWQLELPRGILAVGPGFAATWEST